MDIYEIKVLLALHVGNEELVLKNAGGKKLADSNDYFVVTDDGICHLFDVNGIEKDVSTVTELVEDIVSKDIKKIVIPNSVTSIEYRAFYNCHSLANVTIPNSVTNIGNYAFLGCTSLKSVTIPDLVTSVEYGAFYGCSGLTSVTIGNAVRRIGGYAFHRCSSLTSVTIPDSVKSIEHGAFSNCSSLIGVPIGNGVMSIGNYVFFDCKGLKQLVFKGKTLEEVKAMEDYPWGIKDESIIRCIDKIHAAA